MKRAVTGVTDLSVGQKYLEKALALNGKIKRVTGGGEIALGLDDFCFRCAGTETYLQTRRYRGLLCGGGARHNFVLIQKVGEIHLALLKAGGTGVGEIVGDVVQIELLSGHSAGGSVEGTKHIRILSLFVQLEYAATASAKAW